MATKSKSKTFPKESGLGEVVTFILDQIETVNREVPYGGAEPGLDVLTETVHKYIVTITKVEEVNNE